MFVRKYQLKEHPLFDFDAYVILLLSITKSILGHSEEKRKVNETNCSTEDHH